MHVKRIIKLSSITTVLEPLGAMRHVAGPVVEAVLVFGGEEGATVGLWLPAFAFSMASFLAFSARCLRSSLRFDRPAAASATRLQRRRMLGKYH